MRVAFFSPLPPARSGIADYSAALLDAMRHHADVEAFSAKPESFDPSQYDVLLYQLGNNGDHAFVYEMALAHPGIVVLHEANLHHLIADITIRRNDWKAYCREVEFDGGPRAAEYAQRVRALEIGPDYDGVPMLRRILSVSRGVIVHSKFVEAKVRETGFTGPISVIPHGAWLPEETDREAFRAKLDISDEPLVGVFGHLKPYKRIIESLRAFRAFVKQHPTAKMILVGEPHPELPLDVTIESLGLLGNVRVVGHTPIEDFMGYLSACDIVLNLRYPTVGETSGTLLRALGLGRAVLVSDVGAFSEFPDDICLKVPVGHGEEQLIFEYLQLCVTRPDLAHAMGERARNWVAQECSWTGVAEKYIQALHRETAVSAATKEIAAWTNPEPGGYVDIHLTRLATTLAITPPGSAADRVLEMGAYMHITPALKFKLGYGEVRGCYYGRAGSTDHKIVNSTDGRAFECDIDLFDAERDRFPYPDEWFSTVLCCELVEHLPADPMHMMSEINRILKPDGHLVLTTPNIASLRAINAILSGYHPGFFPAYLKPESLAKGDSRHNREYTARETYLLLHYAGFDITLLETGAFNAAPAPELASVERLLSQHSIDQTLRGEGIYVVGRKTGPILERYPAWLYSE